MFDYPTPETILAKEHLFKPELLRLVREWKREFFPGWKDKAPLARFEALEVLIHRMADFYGKPVYTKPCGSGDCYFPGERTIYIQGKSIITALHEFAHHIFGASETKACRWSVWLFKKVFPKSFEKLHFVGHMLVQK